MSNPRLRADIELECVYCEDDCDPGEPSVTLDATFWLLDYDKVQLTFLNRTVGITFDVEKLLDVVVALADIQRLKSALSQKPEETHD